MTNQPVFDPKVIVPLFDRYLTERGLTFSAIAIGGAALAILEIIARPTRDVDLLEHEIPKVIREAAQTFATTHALSEDWLNTGPSSLMQNLPPDWRKNLQSLYAGQSLNLSTLGRRDFILAKFWAMCDRMRDIDDLVAIAPTDIEIKFASDWAKPLDGNPQWPQHVENMAFALRRRLGHG